MVREKFVYYYSRLMQHQLKQISVVYCGPVLQLGLSTVRPQRYVSRQIRGKFIARIWNFELKQQQRVVGYMHDCQVSQNAGRCSVIIAA